MASTSVALTGILLVLGMSIGSAQNPMDSIPCTFSSFAGLMLEKNPYIKQAKLMVLQQQSARQLATSTFDYTVYSDLNTGRNRDNLSTLDSRHESVNGRIMARNWVSSTGLQKTFRSGLTATSSIDYSRISDNFPYGSFGESQLPFTGQNRASLALDIRQPLLRGRGSKYTAASERYGQKMVQSRTQSLHFTIATELLNLVDAYWNYLESYQSLQIYQENELRITRLLEVTEELVEADKKTENDLKQIQADLLDQQRQSLSAQQFYFSARQNLGRTIGLDVSTSQLIGTPMRSFPTIEETGYKAHLDLTQFIALAKEKRADLKALLIEKEGLNELLLQAKNGMMPQLDFLASTSYGGGSNGNHFRQILSPLSQQQGGNAFVGVGLSFWFPVNNNAAQARLLESESSVANQQVMVENQIRIIELNISIALNDLHNSASKLRKAKESLSFHRKVYEDEQLKFRSGLTTLLNLILFQQRLTLSQLDYLAAQREFITAVAMIRHETGTLLNPENPESIPAYPSVFYTIPERD
jgi:outer membrane protein